MMSSIANLSSAPPTLPALNLHTHGHKKGQRAQPIDEPGDSAAATPRDTQSLFGRLLQSLEKVIGAKLGVATSAATNAAASAGASANTAAAAGAHISVKA